MANYYAESFPTFQRAMRNILSITNSFPAVVTTTLDGLVPGNHDYSTGLIVSLSLPWGSGMELANQYYGPITVLNATQFSIPIDTTTYDPFIPFPVSVGPMPVATTYGTPAQVVPIGEVNDLLTMATQNVLPYP